MIDKKKLEELVPKLKDEHGDELHLVTVEDQQFIARAPTRAEYQRFMEQASETKKRMRAMDTLSKACVLYPDVETLDALFERRPGLSTSIGTKLMEFAGVIDDVESKKL